MLKYVPSHEGVKTERAAQFPLQLVSPHPRFSFHTQGDGKDSFVNDIDEHRILVDGRYYWILRINPDDAAARGIRESMLLRVFNDRGAVVCAARLTHCTRPGVVIGCEGSARFEPVGDAGNQVELGGTLNLLTPKRSQFSRGHALGNSNCLVQVDAWAGPVPAASRAAAAEAVFAAAK